MAMQKGCKPLSVTCGDSSPAGRAKTFEKDPLYSADAKLYKAFLTYWMEARRMAGLRFFIPNSIILP